MDSSAQARQGSSPRIRGESALSTLPTWGGRIIPANTGRIIHITPINHPRADHPREYGENLYSMGVPSPTAGSSPRIRGEWASSTDTADWPGIIPANTGRMNRVMVRAGMCSGSSPRIRGEYSHHGGQDGVVRIIPANTGRIGVRRGGGQSQADHPREYGENNCAVISRMPTNGSSPRIRGELFYQLGCGHSIGIIPANTGRMILFDIGRLSPRDHPREYGENDETVLIEPHESGSSPRIRGESRCQCRFRPE